MGSRIGFMIFLFTVINYTLTNARSSVALDKIGFNIPTKDSEVIIRDEKLCTLCEEYTAEAVYYLGQNETQSQIVSTLHHACSRLHSLEIQCVILVDYYAPIFFTEIATIPPEQFCEKVNLCEELTLVRLPRRDDACKFCHNVVAEFLVKLKDPDTQLDIIEVLLKGCNKVENFVQQCKKFVFEYGPLILANAEKFVETNDICTAIHACKPSQEVAAS